MSSMQAVASSAVSWPHTGEDSYSFFNDNSQEILCIHSKYHSAFIIAVAMENWIPATSQSFICGVKALAYSDDWCNTLAAHVDPPLSWMILLRYSAVRLLRVSLCGGPRRWGKTTDVSTTVPWSNYSKQEKS